MPRSQGGLDCGQSFSFYAPCYRACYLIEVENRVFGVHAVSYGEHRGYARAVTLALSSVRTMALKLIRHLGFRYVPDDWRALTARPDWGLSLLLHPTAKAS